MKPQPQSTVLVREMRRLEGFSELAPLGDPGPESVCFPSSVLWSLCRDCHFSVTMQSVPSFGSLAVSSQSSFQEQRQSWELPTPTWTHGGHDYLLGPGALPPSVYPLKALWNPGLAVHPAEGPMDALGR